MEAHGSLFSFLPSRILIHFLRSVRKNTSENSSKYGSVVLLLAQLCVETGTRVASYCRSQKVSKLIFTLIIIVRSTLGYSVGILVNIARADSKHVDYYLLLHVIPITRAGYRNPYSYRLRSAPESMSAEQTSFPFFLYFILQLYM
jgi:hypothetical protein